MPQGFECETSGVIQDPVLTSASTWGLILSLEIPNDFTCAYVFYT